MNSLYLIIFIFFINFPSFSWGQFLSDIKSEEVPSSEYFYRISTDQFLIQFKYHQTDQNIIKQNNIPSQGTTKITAYEFSLLYGYEEDINLGVKGTIYGVVNTNSQITAKGPGNPNIFILGQNENSFFSLGLEVPIEKAYHDSFRYGGNKFYFSLGSNLGEDTLNYGYNIKFDYFSSSKIHNHDGTELAKVSSRILSQLAFWGEKKFQKSLLGASITFFSESEFKLSSGFNSYKIQKTLAPELDTYFRLEASENFMLIIGGTMLLANDKTQWNPSLSNISSNEYEQISYYLILRVII